MSHRRQLSTPRYVIQRSLSGSICDDDTRIWEDPPPPYSFEDPSSSSSFGSTGSSDGDVFVPAHRISSSTFRANRGRDPDDVFRIMSENDALAAAGELEHVRAFSIPTERATKGIVTFREAPNERYIKREDDGAKIEYLL